MKFKIGDRVKLIRWKENLGSSTALGSIGTILGVFSVGFYPYKVKFIGWNHLCPCLESELELIKPTTNKELLKQWNSNQEIE